ncbi:MAG: carbohydrate kinase family protein [Chloroflexi bacterium]|nr:carbohydrate kinase family protein [Chloroflexota bacterium]
MDDDTVLDSPFEVIVAGHICLDLIPELPDVELTALLQPGALTEIGPVAMSTGGVVSNTGRSLHRLGVRTGLMGKVGADQLGQITLDLIRVEDPVMAEGMIVAQGETSSYTIVISPPQTDRIFLHAVGANQTFGADDVNYEQVRGARLFHFGYPPYLPRLYADDGAELVDMFQRAKETGVITSLDTAMPDPNSPGGQVDWRLVLARTLPYVDLFLPSLDELRVMLGREDEPVSDAAISTLAAEVLEMGTRVVVIKLGARGMVLRTGEGGAPHTDDAEWRNRELWVPPFVPDYVVGTTGAGDASIAGFLAGMLRGQSVTQALTTAVAVGACNVEAPDALSGVRSWEDTQARIAAGWARAPLTINAPGWEWDKNWQVWVGPHDKRNRKG